MEKMNIILNIISEQIKNISILLSPIIPIAANKALDILNVPKNDRNFLGIKKENIFDFEKKLNKHEILFKKVDTKWSTNCLHTAIVEVISTLPL